MNDPMMRIAVLAGLVGAVALAEGLLNPRRRDWLVFGAVCWALGFEAASRVAPS